MKKARRNGLRREYRRADFGPGARGKHLRAYRAGTNLVLLDPEVAAAFPTDQAVNGALRSLIDVARHSVGRSKHSSRRVV